jgi:hypothetical protein
MKAFLGKNYGIEGIGANLKNVKAIKTPKLENNFQLVPKAGGVKQSGFFV